eukprot:2940991-Prymnesium_polylepis.2
MNAHRVLEFQFGVMLDQRLHHRRVALRNCLVQRGLGLLLRERRTQSVSAPAARQSCTPRPPPSTLCLHLDALSTCAQPQCGAVSEKMRQRSPDGHTGQWL